MDNESANYYTREVMVILIREFQSPDEEMKKIVLKVVKQCCMTDGVEPHYIKEEILPHFFKHFWNHRMALDRRNFRQVTLPPSALCLYPLYSTLSHLLSSTFHPLTSHPPPSTLSHLSPSTLSPLTPLILHLLVLHV